MYSDIHIGTRPSEHNEIMGSTNQPWLVKESIEFLFDRINSNHNIFEFGSGSSTFWFSKFANRVYSIESDKKWYQEVHKTIISNNISNIEINLKECDMKYITTVDTEYEDIYKDYANSINDFKMSFDFILIDGVARTLCIKNALHKLKPNGFLIIDNAERPAYHSGIELIPKSWNKYEFSCSVDTTLIYEKTNSN